MEIMGIPQNSAELKHALAIAMEWCMTDEQLEEFKFQLEAEKKDNWSHPPMCYVPEN